MNPHKSVRPTVLVLANRRLIINADAVEHYLEDGARFDGHEKVHHNEKGYFTLNSTNRCTMCGFLSQCYTVRLRKLRPAPRPQPCLPLSGRKPRSPLEDRRLAGLEPYLLSLGPAATEIDKLFVILLAAAPNALRFLRPAILKADDEMKRLASLRALLRNRGVPVSHEEDVALCKIFHAVVEEFRKNTSCLLFSEPCVQNHVKQSVELARQYLDARRGRYQRALNVRSDEMHSVTQEVTASLNHKLEMALGLAVRS